MDWDCLLGYKLNDWPEKSSDRFPTDRLRIYFIMQVNKKTPYTMGVIQKLFITIIQEDTPVGSKDAVFSRNHCPSAFSKSLSDCSPYDRIDNGLSPQHPVYVFPCAVCDQNYE